MCLIVHRPIGKKGRGSHVPNDVIDRNLGYNDDGFGIGWRDSAGKLHFRKYGPKDAAKFRAMLKEIDANDTTEYVAHFRMATHGPACEDLSHPFAYTDPEHGEVLIFHNGVIGIKTNKDESDTSRFVYGILKALPSGWFYDPVYVCLVEMAIGGSRMVVMTAKDVIIIGEGKTENGIWYSTDPRPVSWKTMYASYDHDYASGRYATGANFSKSAAKVVNREPAKQTRYRKNKYGVWVDDEDPTQTDEAWENRNAKDWENDDYNPHLTQFGMIVDPPWRVTGPDFVAHEVWPSVDVSEGLGEAFCHTCDAEGEFYVIDERLMLDIRHTVNTAERRMLASGKETA